MKRDNILVTVLLLAGVCTLGFTLWPVYADRKADEAFELKEIEGTVRSTEEYRRYLDSLDASKEVFESAPDTSETNNSTWKPLREEEITAPSAPTNPTKPKTTLRPVIDTLGSLDAPVLSDTSALFRTENRVIGVTEVIFVWQGDTCTTSRLRDYLYLFDDDELTVPGEEIHSHVVFLMLSGMLLGDATAGVVSADQYILDSMCCGGLSEYVAYALNHE